MRRIHGNSTAPLTNLAKSSIIDKSDLPQHIQNRMKKVKADSAVVRIGSPNFYHPLFQTLNMLLPRDRRERNEWCRHFYRTEGVIATAIDIHSEFPISEFNIVAEDIAVERFFNYMLTDKLDMFELLLSIGHEFWCLGDVFPHLIWSESDGLWTGCTLLNPDYVNITTSLFAGEPQMELIPDEQITNIISGGPAGQYRELYAQFPEEVITQVRSGKNISLDNRLVSHIAYKASPYETFGTPLMMRCFKTLIYKDKLRQAQDAIANRHIFPLRVAKLGTPGEPMPTQDEVDDFRDVLMEADNDPTFWLVYHYGLNFDFVGSSGKILPLNTEFEFIDKELLVGMCITQGMLTGDGSSYSAANVGYDALARRYMIYRARLEHWIRRHVCKPVAEVQGFYKPKNGTIASKHMTPKELKRSVANKEMELILPQIQWRNQDLTSNQTIMSFIEKLHDTGVVSTTTSLRLVSLNPEVEKRNLDAERGTILDPQSPKTGPLAKDMHIDRDFETGNTIREYNPTDELKNENPAIPHDVKLNNDPSDFGFPSKHVENSLHKRTHAISTKPIVSDINASKAE